MNFDPPPPSEAAVCASPMREEATVSHTPGSNEEAAGLARFAPPSHPGLSVWWEANARDCPPPRRPGRVSSACTCGRSQLPTSFAKSALKFQHFENMFKISSNFSNNGMFKFDETFPGLNFDKNIREIQQCFDMSSKSHRPPSRL